MSPSKRASRRHPKRRTSPLVSHAVWPLLAVVLFAVLLGVVLHTQQKPPEEPVQTAVEPPWDRASDDVVAVSPSFADGEQLTIERRDGAYWMTSPVELPAALDDGNRLFMALASPQVLKVVDEDATDRLSEFGLDDPYGSVDVTFSDGDTHRLLIGDTSPVSQSDTPDRYAMEAGGSVVYLYSGMDIDFLRRAPAEWRDRDVLKLDLDKVARVDIWEGEDPANSFTLEKQNAPADGFQWLVRSPDFTAPAGTQDVRNFISSFDQAEVTDFVDDAGAEEDYGLDPGYMRFVFSDENGQELGVLHLGKFADNKGQTMYGSNDEWAFPFIISTSLFGQANPSAWDLAETLPFAPATYSNITKLVWTPGDGPQVTVSRPDTEDSVSEASWSLQVDGEDRAQPDSEAVSDIAEKLLALKGDSLWPMENLGERGQEPPAGTLSVTWATDDGTATEITVVVGTTVDETRYIAIDGYDLLYRVADDRVAAILEAIENLNQ